MIDVRKRIVRSYNKQTQTSTEQLYGSQDPKTILINRSIEEIGRRVEAELGPNRGKTGASERRLLSEDVIKTVCDKLKANKRVRDIVAETGLPRTTVAHIKRRYFRGIKNVKN